MLLAGDQLGLFDADDAVVEEADIDEVERQLVAVPMGEFDVRGGAGSRRAVVARAVAIRDR